MAELETEPQAPLPGVVRIPIALATLGALAYFGFDLVSLAFRLGTRVGVRSAVGIALPLLWAGFAFVARPDALRRTRSLPVAVLFPASLAAGALGLASIRLFLRLQPIPIAELAIASCFAVVAVAGLARSGSPEQPARPLALVVGVAAGVLLYIAVWGVPRIVPG